MQKNLPKTLKKVLTKRGRFDKIYKLLARGAPNLENDTERRRKKERQLILRASDPSESLGCG